MQLHHHEWQRNLFEYYSQAFWNGDEIMQNSLFRLINSTSNRYNGKENVAKLLDYLRREFMNQENDRTKSEIEDSIIELINLAFPGDVSVERRVSIQYPFNHSIPVFSDTVYLKNSNTSQDAIDASGYHTYWNTYLEEIVSNANIKYNIGFDDNLPDVQVRMLDQSNRLARKVIIIPTYEFQTTFANQIIYHDLDYFESNSGIGEVAVENTRQKGDDGYPNKGRIIKPGQSSTVGFTTIIIPSDSLKRDLVNVLKYVNQVQQNLSVQKYKKEILEG